MREKRLVWSGWGVAEQLDDGDYKRLNALGHGLRKVTGIDTARLRLFLLSLLWRAAASDLREMSEIVLPADDLEALRTLLLTADAGAADFYPATLVQLITKGDIHNQSPLAQNKIVPSFMGTPGIMVPVFRFYFDGLVVYFHRHSADAGYTASLGPVMVGGDPSTMIVTGVSYEASFQRQNLWMIATEAEDQYPSVIDRLRWTRE